MLSDLNEQQLSAVLAEESAILCVAGPGTGKTNTLTRRIAHRIEHLGVHPSRVLCLTFTNKAAGEMRERLTALLGEQTTRRLTIGTFHSTCLRILQQWGEHIGYRAGAITVYDEIDRRDIIKKICEDLHQKYNKAAFETAATDLGCRAVPEEDLGPEVRAILREYQSRLIRNNAVDFTTILTETNRLFRECPEALEHCRGQWHEIYVDEYQDTDRVQYNLHHLLQPERLFAIGDPDQAIYGFRGADQSIILSFEQDHPGARIVRLTKNYRSGRAIVDAANAVIRHNKNRIPNTIEAVADGGFASLFSYQNTREQAEAIADKLRDADAPHKETAILYRLNNSSVAISEALGAAGVPFQILTNEKEFYDQQIARGFLSLLRTIHNPRDSHSAWLAVRWFGPHVQPLLWHDYVIQSLSRGVSIYEVMSTAAADEFLKSFSRKALALHEISKGVPAHEVCVAADQSLEITEKLNTFGLATREATIMGFIQRVTEWVNSPDTAGTLLADWLGWFALRSQQDSLRRAEDSVKLLTIHAAKGLEWDTVYIVDATAGAFRQGKNDAGHEEEERRVFYVGLTRARNHAEISWPMMAGDFGGRSKKNKPCSFALEAAPEW